MDEVKAQELKEVLEGAKPKNAEAVAKLTHEKRQYLDVVFALRDGVTVEHIVRWAAENGLIYVIKLSTGESIEIGPAKDVLKHGKCAEAFAESLGHVIPGKEKKDWEDVAQFIFDIEKAMREPEENEETEAESKESTDVA